VDLGASPPKPAHTTPPGSLPSSSWRRTSERLTVLANRCQGHGHIAQATQHSSHQASILSGQGAQFSYDFWIRIADIRGGTTLRFDVQQNNLRLCTIMEGKLKVRIEGEPEFLIGRHGVFRIRPGATASAANMAYSWAAVHIMTQTEYA
jgi:hypothetical protein